MGKMEVNIHYYYFVLHRFKKFSYVLIFLKFAFWHIHNDILSWVSLWVGFRKHLYSLKLYVKLFVPVGIYFFFSGGQDILSDSQESSKHL